MEPIKAHPPVKNAPRHGTVLENRKSRQDVKKRIKNTNEDSDSSEKLVRGATMATRRSCTMEKSSMLFCRSRMFLKKSLLISGAGLMPRGNAEAGPRIEKASFGVAPGGGGCRVM